MIKKYLLLIVFFIGCKSNDILNHSNNNDSSSNSQIISSCSVDICLYIIDVDPEQSTLSIMMENSTSVAGFQFDIEGINILSAYGGSASQNNLSTNNNNNKVLAFSLSGSIIPPGSGILTNIYFSNNNGSICIKSPVFSDGSGKALEIKLGDCYN